MVIKKFKILSALFFMGCALYANAQTPKINNDKFIAEYQSVVKAVINSYNNPKLDAQIFDIHKPSFLGFLEASRNYQKPRDNDLMGMMYYKDFKVRGKETSFCFILYDSQSGLIENYLANSSLNLNEIIEYLALHETAHCLLIDYARHNNLDTNNKKMNELQAEKFVIYLLNYNDKQSMIDKILNNNKNQKKDAIHYNYEELFNFTQKIRNKEIPEYDNYLDLITDISYNKI